MKRSTVYKAAGISRELAMQWIKQGIIREPYTLPHVAGLAIGAWSRRRGIGFAILPKIVDFFSSLSEAQVQEHFNRGERFFVLNLANGEASLLAEDDLIPKADPFEETQFLVLDFEQAYQRVRYFIGKTEG